ncbi:hypothetical protein SLS63_008447 [Diaporthe eres]|uniref:Geranylgeranyl pyrophosphate synthase n=1 Tax=Diaporthe eres TaxID=83184 RepID=A0ABR1P2J6_DIAER
MGTKIVAKTLADVPGLGLVHPMALTIPNCLPDRLPAITRFADYTILNDDYYDFAEKDDIENVNNDIKSALQGFSSGPTKATVPSTQAFKSKQLQAGLLLELINLDQDLAMDIMNSYSEGLDIATFAPDDLKTLDAYLPIRKVNSGLDVTRDMACFGMGIRISKEEKSKLQEVVDLATYAVTLVNDMYSWPKEIKCHMDTPGSNAPFNAVAVLMRHGGCSEAEAFRVLREKQTELEERDIHLLHELKAREGGRLPGNQELYVLTAQHAVSGSELWSIFSKRYPSKEELGQREVECVDGMFRFKNTVLLPEDQERYEDARETVEIGIEIEKQLSALHVGVVEIIRPITPPASSGGEASTPSTSGLSNAVVAREVCKDSEEEASELAPAADVKPIQSGLLPSSGASLVTYASRIEAAPDHVALAPFKYIASLPSKGIRDTFVDALNWWLDVPEASMQSIKTIVSMLHDSSLILDDIEDDSTLRRGSPAVHVIYGTAQSINSANYMMVMALSELQKLRSPKATAIFIEELESLFLGQSEDLHWKYQVEIPSEEDYMEMIDKNPRPFVRQLSLYFQIRDDYQNLVSDQYAKQKGFAEDLDEGKISLPMIYTLQRARTRAELMGILKHKAPGVLPLEVKQYMVREMRQSGALQATHQVLGSMQGELMAELRRLEGEFGSKNSTLELVLRKLWIS